MMFHVNENVVFERVGEETFLFNIDTSRMFTLNQIGERIFELIKSKPAIGEVEVVDFILNSFDCSKADAQRDAKEFISNLLKESMISEDH